MREAIGQGEHGVLCVRRVTVVQREGNALALQHDARQLYEYGAQFTLQFGDDICVGVQADNVAIGTAAFRAVHAGNHQAGQGEQGFEVMHCPPADDGQRATAGGMQCGERFAQRRRDTHGIGVRGDVDGALPLFERAQEVEERGQEVGGVGVLVEASHFCMMMRGVEKQHSSTVTSTMLGNFRSRKETRDEFLALVRNK